MRHLTAVLFAMLTLAPPAVADHPSANLDELLGSKEDYFQAIDKPVPSFALRDARGDAVTLDTFSDKILVLHFIYASCPDFCPLLAEKLADVQAMINQSPMKDMVQFITVTTDPVNETPNVLEAYGPAHGLDPSNWTFRATRPDQNEDATRKLAETLGHRFTMTEAGYQTHGVVTHVVDRPGAGPRTFTDCSSSRSTSCSTSTGLPTKRRPSRRSRAGGNG